MYNKFEILLVVFMPNIKPILILTSRVKTICTRYDISDYVFASKRPRRVRILSLCQQQEKKISSEIN